MTTSSGSRPDWEKLGQYLAGELSADEAAGVRRWLDDHPDDAELLAALDRAATRAAAAPVVDVERALARVRTRARTQARTAVRRFVAFGAVAAALALAAVLIPWSRFSIDVTVARAPVAFSTQVGQRDSLRLPDSTSVVLGPGSRIRYSSEGGVRLVDLEGQALFRVVHEAERQFIVRAGATRIRDIGTEFSVHGDSSQPVRVVVHDGIVEVRASGVVTLNRGDVATVGADGAIETRRQSATADDLAWTRGQLVFRNATLADVAADLRRWYGVELRVTDTTLMRRHFSGTFGGQDVNEVLQTLALALPARIERRGDTAWARPAAATR